MSELKTNKITPATGTNVVMGDSGDSFTLAAGATATGFGTEITKSANNPAADTNPSGGVGTMWLNTTTGEMYSLTDATAGANVWTNVGDGSGSEPFTPTVATSDGAETTDGNYKVHTFTSSGTFTISQVGSAAIEYLCVAGGGGGGSSGGGGGAGGYLVDTTSSLSAQAYTVTVGAGGGHGSNNGNPGGDGNNSVFGSIISTGGGGGAAWVGAELGSWGTGGTGGAGGGGQGGQGLGAGGTNGQTNTGGGAGGHSQNASRPNGTGGSGIVVIRYPI